MISKDKVKGCCLSLALPIRACHRPDIWQGHAEQGANLFSVCCGEFWQGTPEDLAKAEKDLENDPV